MAETDKTDTTAPQAETVTAALTRLREILNEASRLIRQVDDSAQQYADASKLMDILLEAQRLIGAIRVQAAHSTMTRERLSLAGLAARLGVSKSRADQLIRTARAGGAENGPPRSDR